MFEKCAALVKGKLTVRSGCPSLRKRVNGGVDVLLCTKGSIMREALSLFKLRVPTHRLGGGCLSFTFNMGDPGPHFPTVRDGLRNPSHFLILLASRENSISEKR
jgi:hypothetical protein